MFFLFFNFLFSFFTPELPQNIDLNNPPPRIIRTCCAFGADVGVMGIPFLKLTEVTSKELLGPHKYLGNKNEKNGIIYSKKGGFIDIGHLRDIADITAFLYALIEKNKDKGSLELKLGNEAGNKVLSVFISSDLSKKDLVMIAGKAAYDLSVWHEISTWNGASFIPLVPERYSSYSVEDAFSNLLGVHLGMQAILSSTSYESTMDSLIQEKLHYYEAVDSYAATVDAMNKVDGIWWNSKVRFPRKGVLILRVFDLYGCISPLLIETGEYNKNELLCVPTHTEAGKELDDYYTLSVDTNFRIPVQKALHKKDKMISQRDFPELIKYSQKRFNQR